MNLQYSSRASSNALLFDLAIQRQSTRISALRAKYDVQIDRSLRPNCVCRSVRQQRCQTQVFQSDARLVKTFTASTKTECVKRRERWMKTHPHRIRCLKNFTPQQMIDMSTDHESDRANKHGYWNLYRYRTKNGYRWTSKLPIQGVDHQPFSGAVQHLSQSLNAAVYNSLSAWQAVNLAGPPTRAQIMRCIKDQTRELIVRTQTDDCALSKTATALLSRRGGWFRDRLLDQVRHPMMRHLRNIRINSSF